MFQILQKFRGEINVTVINSRAEIKNNGLIGCILFFVAAVCILGFSSATSKGAMNGLKISSYVIIPSLFPFTVCSVFFQKSGGLLWISNKLNKITTFLFKISGTEFSVILLSLLGGYPIGAKIADELYLSGEVHKQTAKKLLRFSVNPSPAFFISIIGINILKNALAGGILLIANLTSCLILNRLFVSKSNVTRKSKSHTYQGENFSDSFVKSVLAGAEITINICSFVILFSSIAEILKTMPIDSILYSYICPFLEISFGINEISKIGIPTHFYGFLLSFGGISTICQVKQAAKNINPSFFYLFFHRMIHAFTTLIISLILFKIFPLNSEVFSNNVDITFTEYPLFVPSVMLIVFSVLFLMFLSSKKQTNLQN